VLETLTYKFVTFSVVHANEKIVNYFSVILFLFVNVTPVGL